MLRLMSFERNWTGFACLKSITMNQFGAVVSKNKRRAKIANKRPVNASPRRVYLVRRLCVFFGSAFFYAVINQLASLHVIRMRVTYRA